MILIPSCRTSISRFVSTTSKSRQTLRAILVIALVTGIAIVIGSPSSAGSVARQLFTRAASLVAGRQAAPAAKAAPSNVAASADLQDPGSSMTIERRGHTATRLSDGRVLIVGGENSSGELNQAEIYNASSATFSSTGNMTDARSDHTATLLGDGRVLLAGGRNAAGAVATTEIFDPTTGTFTSGPTMSVARAGHSATPFPDGRILFAGGNGNGSAEILDASLSSFTAAGSLGTPRSAHSAALLLDGRVLIVGGRDAGGAELSSGEVFDNGSFAAVDGALDVARVRAHLRVLFDGKVQIIGGSNDGSMEIYDPSIATFGAYAHVAPEGDTCAGLPAQVQGSQTRAALFHNGQSDPIFDRSSHTMSELGTQAIVIGGANSAEIVLNSTPLFGSSNAQISTDKLDYSPGETAHISGRGFQAGETVRVKIHEDPHTPQERGFDAVADADGNFSGDYSVQDYDLQMKFLVGARGLTSGFTAQTTFTDDVTVKVVSAPSGTTFTLTKTLYSSPNCNTGAGAPITILNVNSTAGDSTVRANGTSIKLQAAATSNQGTAFSGWTSASGFNTIDAFTICVNGANAIQTRTYTANYVANVPPVASAVSITGTPEYGSLLTGNYTYSDADGDMEGTSTFRWLRNGGTVVGTSQTYTTVAADVGQTLTFEVTPVAATGTSPGAAVTSPGVLIGKASSTTTVTCASGSVYTGSPIEPCTYTVTGNEAGNPVLVAATAVPSGNYTNNINAGVNTASASFTFTGDANHNGSSDSENFSIDKAGSTTTVTCASGSVYTGSPIEPCTYTVTGNEAGNPVLVAATAVPSGNYTNNINAGVNTASASFTFTGDANHNGSSDSENFSIDKAGSTTTVTCAAGSVYTGSPIEPCTYTVTGNEAGNPVLVAATAVPSGNYTNNINAGVNTASASFTFTGDANHNGSNDSENFSIDKAGSTTTVTCASGSVYTGSPIEPCTYTVTGNEAGNPVLVAATAVPSGNYTNNINAGVNTASASFTFTGDANHNGSSDSENFSIDKANQTITWSNPAAIVYGTALSVTQFNATVAGVPGGSAPGALTYTPPAGTVLNAGNGQTLAVDAAATSNYNAAHKEVLINVNKASLTITASSHTVIFNDPVPTISPSYSGFVNGDDPGDLTAPTCSTTYTVGSLVGTYPSKCENAISGNYNFTYINGTVTVNTACTVFNGFLPPIGGSVETGNGGSFADPVRAFKLGSTIPVKFSAICFGVPLTTGVHTLQAIKYTNATDGDTPIDATPTDAATVGNQFRITGTEWHFNMNTKAIGNGGHGTWYLEATLFDGSKYHVWVSIKK